MQVIEAAIENIPIKQQIFADLETACSKECILSSNTSTIDISLIGKKTDAAERIIGAHFFSPAHIMPLLEIVRTNETSKQVYQSMTNGQPFNEPKIPPVFPRFYLCCTITL